MVYTDDKHLTADKVNELHEFAAKLGLQRRWFQNHPKHPHYDLFGKMIWKAKAMGAVKVSSKKIVELFRRNEPNPT